VLNGIGGRTIVEAKRRISASEFQSWRVFYSMFPFDDLHRFHRPAALIALSMSGGEISDKLDWLAPDPREAGMTQADRATIRAMRKLG
jgi:hypothetical protein